MRSSTRFRIGIAALLAAVASAALLAGGGGAATITVTTTAQLQSAIASAANGDVIVLGGGTYDPTATLDVKASITIQGPTTGTGATISGASVVPDANLIDDVFNVEPGTTVTIQNVTITAAKADGYGINSVGTLNMESVTMTGNLGPAVWASGPLTLTNSTISGNSDTGVMVDSTATFQNVTIADNGLSGIANASLSSRVTLTNSIVWHNALRDCSAPVEQPAGSLDGDGSCGVGALSRTDPKLGALASNGGTTQTRALPALSPAIDAGTTPCPSTDQRGTARDTRCDVGAYEWVDPTPPTIQVPTPITVSAPTPVGTAVSYTITVADIDDPVASSGCTPPSGSTFPVGTTIVHCTATDNHGNSATASFTVTVNLTVGLGCRADGKVSGRGGVLSGRAEALFAAGFRDDVCGAVTDANGNTMTIYNYDTLTDSAAGLAAASCRTDAFAGSDIPYDTATLAQLNGAPGAYGCSRLAGIAPPYLPRPAPYPDAGDTSAPIMTFPIALSSISLGVNLQAADCGGTKPAAPQLTTSMTSRLLGGDIKTWDDPALRAGGVNAALANCHKAVTRVVRQDKATTTTILKQYLVNADNLRSTSTSCFVGGRWTAYATDSANTLWPTGAACSNVVAPSSAGPAAQLSLCASTSGALCYADLPDILSQSTLARPSLRNATDTAYAGPVSGSRSNCSTTPLALPGSTSAAAVGLDTSDTWATDNAAGNHGDLTFKGKGYPICEAAWALVYTGGKAGTAVSRLVTDQRQTLYAYFLYVLSSPGQDRVAASGFTSVPVAVVATLRGGFQGNF